MAVARRFGRWQMRPQPDGTNAYVKPGGSRGRYFSMQSDPDFEQDLETFGGTLSGDWSKAEIIREALARACGRTRTVETVPVLGMETPKKAPGNPKTGPGNSPGNSAGGGTGNSPGNPEWPPEGLYPAEVRERLLTYAANRVGLREVAHQWMVKEGWTAEKMVADEIKTMDQWDRIDGRSR